MDSNCPDRDAPECEALSFVVGGKRIIKGLERGVVGMCVGETRELRLRFFKLGRDVVFVSERLTASGTRGCARRNRRASFSLIFVIGIHNPLIALAR